MDDFDTPGGTDGKGNYWCFSLMIVCIADLKYLGALARKFLINGWETQFAWLRSDVNLMPDDTDWLTDVENDAALSTDFFWYENWQDVFPNLPWNLPRPPRCDWPRFDMLLTPQQLQKLFNDVRWIKMRKDHFLVYVRIYWLRRLTPLRLITMKYANFKKMVFWALRSLLLCPEGF